MERQVFPIADNRCHDSRKSYDRHGCVTDQSQDGLSTLGGGLCVTGEVKFLQEIYRGTSAFLCGVSFISFVESQFLVGKLQRFLVTDIILYVFLVCFMEQRKTQRKLALWECYCSFHFVVEVKVSCIYVERNMTFRYAYHFICKYCVFHIYLNIAVGNGWRLSPMLRPWVHGALQARRRKTFQVSNESKAVCS